MKRKVVIVLISAMLLGCLSIPVFAAKESDCLKPKFVKEWFGLGKGYEQLFWNNPCDQVITYHIYSRDGNKKKLEELADSKVGVGTRTFKTAKNSKAKSGYYRYVTYIVATNHVVWKKEGAST